ncbi:MAG: hypothetical protein GX306_04835 [Clostridiales bacterium]|jgi:hypothetical protein|nr:hypothetical protein [Clostridiales bacterium]
MKNRYEINLIQSIKQLKECPTFEINHFLWRNVYRPKAFGQMAMLENYGFVVSMSAMEKDPLRRYTQDEDPVYMDSGLEAFLNFNPKAGKDYFNFEMNANGAILSGFGPGRNRKRVVDITEYRPICTAEIYEESWSVLLKIPMELIQDVYGIGPLGLGDIITCNFFKISEDPQYEHYVSYAPIVSDNPNFHLPEFFGEGIIVDGLS